MLATVQLIGIALAVLSLYQVKLMPETYEQILALAQEAMTPSQPDQLKEIGNTASPVLQTVIAIFGCWFRSFQLWFQVDKFPHFFWFVDWFLLL